MGDDFVPSVFIGLPIGRLVVNRSRLWAASARATAP